MAYVMFKEMADIHTAISHLNLAKKELLETVALGYGKQYHNTSDTSSFTFNNDDFAEELRSLGQYRARLRRSIESEDAESSNGQEARRAIM